jgi:hypothetical protein
MSPLWLVSITRGALCVETEKRPNEVVRMDFPEDHWFGPHFSSTKWMKSDTIS